MRCELQMVPGSPFGNFTCRYIRTRAYGTWKGPSRSGTHVSPLERPRSPGRRSGAPPPAAGWTRPWCPGAGAGASAPTSVQVCSAEACPFALGEGNRDAGPQKTPATRSQRNASTKRKLERSSSGEKTYIRSYCSASQSGKTRQTLWPARACARTGSAPPSVCTRRSVPLRLRRKRPASCPRGNGDSRPCTAVECFRSRLFCEAPRCLFVLFFLDRKRCSAVSCSG